MLLLGEGATLMAMVYSKVHTMHEFNHTCDKKNTYIQYRPCIMIDILLKKGAYTHIMNTDIGAQRGDQHQGIILLVPQ